VKRRSPEEPAAEALEVLSTTRAIRRFRPADEADVDDSLVMRLLDIAIRAPNAGNRQRWTFIVVRRPDTKERLRRLYAAIVEDGGRKSYGDLEAKIARGIVDEDVRSYERMMAGVQEMTRSLGDVPVIIAVLFQPDGAGFAAGGSIYPAVWSLQLAARAFGVGSVNVGALVKRGADVLEILNVPPNTKWELAACVALGFPVGEFSIPRRRPAHDVMFEETWGRRPRWEMTESPVGQRSSG